MISDFPPGHGRTGQSHTAEEHVSEEVHKNSANYNFKKTKTTQAKPKHHKENLPQQFIKLPVNVHSGNNILKRTLNMEEHLTSQEQLMSNPI